MNVTNYFVFDFGYMFEISSCQFHKKCNHFVVEIIALFKLHSSQNCSTFYKIELI